MYKKMYIGGGGNMDLTVRLQILKDAGQISEQCYQSMLKLIDVLAEKWNIILNEENGAMLITHVAIAWERILKHEVINAIEELLYKEVESSKYFRQSQQILTDWELELKKAFPQVEKEYIMLHLCALLEKEEVRDETRGKFEK
jgi:transcriptional regulatory protein LevR